MLGLLLHVLIGYSAQPAGIQVVFYLATLARHRHLDASARTRTDEFGRPTRRDRLHLTKRSPSSRAASILTQRMKLFGDANASH